MGEILDQREYLCELGRDEILAMLERAREDVISGAITYIAMVCAGPSVNYAVDARGERERCAERLLAAAKSAESLALQMLDL
ncbi:hypothetical protein [Paraburkholderia sacchari]|uniref:hypothetical protein n=1 Tax=Paraburkholderia sacchari TaxID=159450 RepID=UPI001BCDF805|nr:hypothetical protein [Paraburkholderia sacchari]